LDRDIARHKATTYKGYQTKNKCRQKSMHPVEFEPMIPVFEQAKAVYALDHVATEAL
jgi:hypothetical protein